MEKDEIIKQTQSYVRNKLEGENSGQDWWHTYRVWKMAAALAKKEDADLFVVELSSLLHDISDHKFNAGDEEIGRRIVTSWLTRMEVDKETIARVCDIVHNISMSKDLAVNHIRSKEGMVVQDADRLDSLGATGIAKTFAFGGYSGKELYNPDIKPMEYDPGESHRKIKGPSVNHFYETVFQLKDMMNTNAGKEVADKRHQFMEKFLDQFMKEWDGKK